jgi:hypothetical protein
LLHPYFLGAICSETLYSRKLSTPPIKLKKNTKIWIFSPCRTGSTLVYNVLKYLCEDEGANSFSGHEKRVVKSHENFDVQGREGYVFITLRNPFEAVKSFCNLRGIRQRWYALDMAQLLCKQYRELHAFYNYVDLGCTKKILIYEEFEDNLPFLLNQIEKVFNQKISLFDRNEINSFFNRGAMKKISDKLGPIHNSDPLTALVGGHVLKPRNKYVQMFAFYRAVIPQLKDAFELGEIEVPEYHD